MIELDSVEFDNANFQSPGFGDLAIVSCFFNWCNYNSPVRNLNRFIRQISSTKVPLFGIELSLTNNFETSGISGWKQIKVNNNNICFQKEALINLCVKSLPKRFTKIAWIDSDVWFDSNDWHVRLSSALDHVKIIQPFRKCYWTNEKGIAFKESNSFLCDPITDNKWRGHPGYAMAAQRSFFEKIGLFPYCAIGNGDTTFALSVYSGSSNIDKYAIRGISKNEVSNKFITWADSVKQYVGESYGVIDGNCYHEHHGSMDNRNYWLRYEKYIKDFHFETDIKLNEKGILEFTDNFSQESRDKVFQYFKDRKEDE